MTIYKLSDLPKKEQLLAIPFLLNSFIKNQISNSEIKINDNHNKANLIHKLCRYLINNKQVYLAIEDKIIVAYLIAGENVIYFVYTKLPYRKLNIASDLINFHLQENKSINKLFYLLESKPFPFFAKKYSEKNKIKIEFSFEEFIKTFCEVNKNV